MAPEDHRLAPLCMDQTAAAPLVQPQAHHQALHLDLRQAFLPQLQEGLSLADTATHNILVRLPALRLDERPCRQVVGGD